MLYIIYIYMPGLLNLIFFCWVLTVEWQWKQKTTYNSISIPLTVFLKRMWKEWNGMEIADVILVKVPLFLPKTKTVLHFTNNKFQICKFANMSKILVDQVWGSHSWKKLFRDMFCFSIFQGCFCTGSLTRQ